MSKSKCGVNSLFVANSQTVRVNFLIQNSPHFAHKLDSVKFSLLP